MKNGTRNILAAGRFFVMLLMVFTMVFGDFSWLPERIRDAVEPETAEAQILEVDIDQTTSVTGTDHANAGPTVVFTSDSTGYRFYKDSGNTCVYSKTTNRGETWGTAVTVDSQTDCIGIAVWYDKWTPGATGTAGTRIHIATIDTGNDDIFYNYLDTAGDTLGLAAGAATSTDRLAVQTASLTTGQNAVSITMATSGSLFASVDDATDSFVVRCPATSTCTSSLNWVEAGTRPQDLANDYSTLVPLMNGNVMIINRDVSADDIRSKIWSATSSAWTTTWVAIDANATEHATPVNVYDVGMSAMISSSTGRIHLAYIADQATIGQNDDDIRTATFDSNVWTLRTAAVTNSSRGITNMALGLDQNDDTVYVAYSATSTTYNSANIYYLYSSSTMQGWSAEVGPIVGSSTDLYGLSFNGASPQRIYLTWFDNLADDVVGYTVYDTAPGLRIGTTTSQVATARATSTNLHVGGAFALTENFQTRNVTSITITETGSIDAEGGLDNIRLLYESDTTYPYNCASVAYGGGEAQYGAIDTDGFSGANGTSTFTDSISVATSSALCIYPVMDVTDFATDLSTIDIEISAPTTDIVATLGAQILPTTTVAITGSTTVFNDDISLTHFHWRNDDSTEAGATSATAGIEDVNYNAYPAVTRKRLRVEVSNEGSTTTLPQQYRLEYAPKTFICAQETGWVDVGAAGGDWDMSNSVNLTDGGNTTNVALGANGAVTDSNTVFLSTNGGQRDTSSQTGLLTLATTSFVELEYSIIPGAGAVAGTAYCFRVTDAGYPLDVYDIYPQATIASDVLLTATSTQKEWLDVPSTNNHLGGAFVIQKQTVGTTDLTSLTITASGSVDYQNDLDNIELRYDLDISSPYDCSSESYDVGDTQYGTTDTDGFGASGTSTFTDTVTISPTQTLCLYTRFDVASTASNGELIDIQIGDPDLDIVRSGGGSIGPSNTLRIIGITELVKNIPTQAHYHFRNDNGSETTATSKTGGVEDTNLTNFEKGTSTRLRILVSNEGGTTTPGISYRLEYAHKTGGSCGASSGWVDVGAAGGDFDMLASANLTEGGNTTNIAVGIGGVTDENTTFLSTNGGVRDVSSQTGSLVLATSSFVELEYSIVSSSTLAAENSTYCFRVSDVGNALSAYTTYPEISLKNVRDFKIQRGTSAIGGAAVGTLTITAGVDYVAPAASTSAFIRLTNTQHTGAGATTSVATQNADDVTVYITNPWNIRNSITFQRQTTAAANSTRFAWEIVEYVGPAGGDNEMIVRQQQVMTYGTASTSASGTPVTGIVTHNDVAVFITGVWNPDTIATNYESMLTTATWSSSTLRAGFNRGTTGTDAVRVSYAVLEFTGANWKVQRVEHAYTATGTAETESMTAVNSISRAFVHAQKRVLSALNSHANFGHQVWLSSVGAVSFQIDASSTVPANHRSVAWVIENTQTKGSPMLVTRSSGATPSGTQPFSTTLAIGTTIDDVSETSIFMTNTATGTGTTFPEPMIMVELFATSTTHYRIWLSNTTDGRSYRTEVVEWPAARRELSQNYYRLYANNDALDPEDPWPQGATDLGENTAMSGLDEPTADGSVVRLRMSLNVSGQSSMPPGIDVFKLQYGKRPGSSCAAVTEWQELGDAASTTAKWRAYSTPVDDGTLLSINPPTAGDLNISVSDRAGTFEEENNTPATSYIVRSGEDIEFDWAIMNNNADEKASYCFRMVESDDTEFDAYNFYPVVRTIGYGAESKNWRWYDDQGSETPTTPLDGVAENVTPINVSYDNAVVLRVTLRESNGAAGTDIKFKLQFSESPTFETATDVVGTSSCADNASYWCYATSSVPDGSTITTALLSDAESCTGGVGRGCGTQNASGTSASTYDQPATSSAEFSFTIRHAGARVNRTYYFRAYDVTNDAAIPASDGESYPSLTTLGATLSFTLSGVAAAATVEGVVTDVTTTPTLIPFGSFTGSTTKNAAYRLNVSTDATEGYQVFVYSRQGFLSAGGDEIAPVAASNTAPVGWATGCVSGVDGCFGYHAGDDTLAGGSTRFSPNDSFAALETVPREVAQSSLPVTSDQVDVLYRVTSRSLQSAGQYSTNLVYIVVPVF